MDTKFGGTVYLNGRRYWWKVTLSGSKEISQIALKPKGSRFATTELATAETIVAELWQKAIFKPEQKPQEFTGNIVSLCQIYMEFCRGYYRKKDGTPTGESENIEYALKPLIEHYGQIRAEDFGPLKLIELRDHMISRRKPAALPPCALIL